MAQLPQQQPTSPRTRKPAMQVAMQGLHRDSTPSPTFRDRQQQQQRMATQQQTMTAGQPSARPTLLRAGTQQPSPTTSTSSIQSSRRSPPPAPPPPPPSVQAGPAPPPPSQQQQLASPPQTFARDEHATPPPMAPVHPYSAAAIHHSLPPPPTHSLSAPNIHQPPNSSMSYPRPQRVGVQGFLRNASFPAFEEENKKWEMNEQIMADIDRADYQQQVNSAPPAPAPGTAGVAYAGGAMTNKIQYSPYESSASNESRRVSQQQPKDQQQRSSPKTHTREKSGSVSSVTRSPEQSRSSPQYHTSPPEVGGGAEASPPQRQQVYPPYDLYPHVARVATPSGLRKSTLPPSLAPTSSPEVAPVRNTPPARQTSQSQTPPVREQPQAKARVEDRSLPFQEEPEEDIGIESSSSNATAHNPITVNRDRHHREPEQPQQRWHQPQPQSAAQDYARRASPPPGAESLPGQNFGGRTSRAENRHSSGDDDELTLNEHDDDEIRPASRDSASKAKPSDADAFTPRSPTADLPDSGMQTNERRRSGQQQLAQQHAYQQATIRARPRAGAADQLGMRGFDPSMFEHNIVDKLRQPAQVQHMQQQHQQQQLHPQDVYAQQQQSHQRQRSFPTIQVAPPLRDVFDPPDAREQYGSYGTNITTSSSGYSYNAAQAPMQARPDPPIPPTPNTSAPSPSPLLSAMPLDNGPRAQLSSTGGYSPAPPAPSPYPFPFPYDHMHRAPPASYTPSAPSVNYEMMAQLQEQMAAQMRAYALNNINMTDSTLSPASTPYPTNYQPWAYLQTSRVYQPPVAPRLETSMSMRSSPSHEPVHLPPAPRAIRRRPPPFKPQPAGKQKIRPPPRVESTQPRDTSPEPTSGEETAGEETYQEHRHPERYSSQEGEWVDGIAPEELGEWVEEDERGLEDDLLDLEFHPSYVNNTEKRRRRWETKYAALVKAFHELDRETDATLFLMAAPNHPGGKLHSLSSRSVRRDPSLLHSPSMSSMLQNFNHLASQRHVARTHVATLADRLSLHTSDGSSESEEELRRMLSSALTSLSTLGEIYETRESRWREEMRRQTEEREAVELLLRQTLGIGMPMSGAGVLVMPPSPVQ